MSNRDWTVHLSPGEVTIAATVAANRQVANREHNVTNLQGGSQAKMTTELVGAFGELAVARMLNVYPDLTTHLRRGGGDLTIGPWTVDVKTTRVPTGDLRIDARKDKLSDIYILAVSDWATITAIGWAAPIMDCTTHRLTDGEWRIMQRDLRAMDTLKDAIGRGRL